MNEESIPFEPQAIKDYLDGAIRKWRIKRDHDGATEEERLMGACYVDAFQSVRMSLFNELLP